MAAYIGPVGGCTRETALWGEPVVSSGKVYKPNLRNGCRKEIVRRVKPGSGPDEDIIADYRIRGVFSQRDLTFPDTSTVNPVALSRPVGDVVCVNKPSRWLVVQHHDVATLEVGIVIQGDVVIAGHG